MGNLEIFIGISFFSFIIVVFATLYVRAMKQVTLWTNRYLQSEASYSQLLHDHKQAKRDVALLMKEHQWKNKEIESLKILVNHLQSELDAAKRK